MNRGILYRKTKQGNYWARKNGHSIQIFKRPHGGWCVKIHKQGNWIHTEGYHTRSLPILNDAKRFVKFTVS